MNDPVTTRGTRWIASVDRRDVVLSLAGNATTRNAQLGGLAARTVTLAKEATREAGAGIGWLGHGYMVDLSPAVRACKSAREEELSGEVGAGRACLAGSRE